MENTTSVDTPQRYQSGMEVTQNVSTRPKAGVDRSAVRYVIQAGDLMPPSTKKNFKAIPGSHLGGQHFSVIQIPGLWRFQGFVSRGRITPLEKKQVIAHMSEKNAVEARKSTDESVISEDGVVKVLPEVRRTAFPYDSLISLQSPHIQAKGLMHASSLDAIDWDTNIVNDIQFAIFPDWNLIEAGKKQLPATVKEFTAYIQNVAAKTSEQAVIDVCSAFLESAQIFENYARGIITKARESVRKGMYESGFAHTYHEFHYHIATQIGEDLESTAKITMPVSSAPQAPAMSDEALDLERRKVAALERQNEIEAQKLAASEVKNADEAAKAKTTKEK